MFKNQSLRSCGLLIVAASSMFVAACKGPAGDPGPAGAAGTAGATGATGAKGDVGSANVTQVSYNTPFAPTASRVLTLPASIDKATIDKSLVVVYIQNAGNTALWYQIPGLVLTDDFRYFVGTSATTQNITIIRASGTAITSISAVRVLIIPAATVVNGRKAAVDYSDYEAVKAYYHLAD